MAWCLVLLSSPAHGQGERKVLLLNSYSYSLKWTTSITRGVEETLLAADPNTKFYVEFMDTKNYVSPWYKSILEEQLRLKYGNEQFDVVITSDDNAVNFALNFRKDIFNNAPIVFCGVNDHMLPTRDDFTNIGGVLESPDVAESLEVALKIDPTIKTFYIVVDETTSGRKVRADAERVVKQFSGRVQLRWIQSVSMEELQEQLSGLPYNSAVLLVTFARDRLGQSFTFNETLMRMYQVCARPIFSLFDFYMGDGIVGGKLTSGKYQGVMAAEIALRVMDGEDINSIPVVRQQANKYMFDYDEMARFGYSLESLPAESIVINVPESLFEKYTYEIIIFGVIIVFLTVIILILSTNIRIRQRAEAELEEMNRYQETLIEQRTEELTQRSKELEIANYELKKLGELKTAVLNTVSHDLRTPLTSVLGFCKLINRDFNKYFAPLCEGEDVLEGRGERIKGNLGIIEEEGSRLTRLINDFLDLSKIESGNIAWHDVAIDSKKLIEQSVPVLEGYFFDSGVSLDVSMADTLPKVVADPDRLLQVLNNLVGNAAKFTHEGSVKVICDVTEAGWLLVEVADTGVGMPAEEVERVFEKFYQVCQDESSTEISRGSGMGLAISKRIVEHYGGRITATSTLDQGSSFIFTIPPAG